ncbi:hypothetical protein IVG45_04595 [Methylomonas sp. LL1]|uniref:sensor histidine kinase n=1 Tax=Methylomonas sp. LL1 TaxID=2785785 RepID=UPI0018C3F9D3|nr:ATP-binding protein [Methylomonas sp. LL1]QPK64254.1 hypothetical protein IVG45_04595 [Methylomonas sp. LL1]
MKDELNPIGAEFTQACLRQRLLAINKQWNAILERESNAVARELHDDLGQLLTALSMQISLFKLRHQDDKDMTETANGMLMLTERCMQSICHLIDNLRTGDAEPNVATVLNRLCHIFERRHKLPCALTISGECKAFDRTFATVFFRIIHESLDNVIRHAGPCKVSITCNYASDTGLEVVVSDSGRGFDPHDTAPHQKRSGLSLMDECAFALGGQIEIASSKNIGTALRLRIPPESFG